MSDPKTPFPEPLEPCGAHKGATAPSPVNINLLTLPLKYKKSKLRFIFADAYVSHTLRMGANGGAAPVSPHSQHSAKRCAEK